MIRTLGAAAVALLCVAAFAVGAEAEAPSSPKAQAPTAERSVVAVHGSYTGWDQAQRAISFTYSGNQVSHFRVGSHTIGGAHVDGSAQWHETCHNGWCFKGHWVSDTEVVGFWKAPQGHWVPWNAFVPMPRTNFQGNYSGFDHRSGSVRMTRHNDFVQHFTADRHTFPSVRVDSRGAWGETCSHSHCYSGHWQDDYHVVGYWWRKSDGHKVAWEAHAYSAR